MADPLAELRPLHLPPEIGWWPPAPAWWLLVVLLVVLVVSLTIAWRRRTPRREALRIVRAIEQQVLSAPLLAQQINVVLRRYAMACYPQDNAGALTGQAWLDFLNRRNAGRELSAALGHALTDAAFAAHAHVDGPELIDLARHWIRHNSRGKAVAKAVGKPQGHGQNDGQSDGQSSAQAVQGWSR